MQRLTLLLFCLPRTLNSGEDLLFHRLEIAEIVPERRPQCCHTGEQAVMRGLATQHPPEPLNDIELRTIPEGHDVILIANVWHNYSPERNVALFHRIRQPVSEGTRRLLVDFWTDPTHTEPLAAALMVGGFLLTTGEGDVYSAEEVHGWL
jgi:hypothetical protein